ncbi:uncharacterized protein [Temnothorax nylanderi]|uniref:uncharacterized protein isoform X1 n=2 Tax=Temnothorax nylanderi TaxID=102681 RepID=UPI003A8858EA
MGNTPTSRTQSMRAQNCDNIRERMKNDVYSYSMKSFKTVFVEDTNISKEETIGSQAALHNVQLIRNLPNILRSNNTKTPKNRKLLDKIDTSFIFSTEDGNTSLELNTTSSSIDLDVEANYNKTTSPKSHHQRKQVHNPLNIQDISDCNNNKSKHILPKIDQFNELRLSSSREENVPAKRMKYNDKQKKRSSNKKTKKVTARKSGSKTRVSCKKPDALATIPDVKIMNTIVQNTNNFFENDLLTQPVCNPNFPNINVNDLHDIATKSVEPFNVFYRNNEVYNFEKKHDVNLNDISYKPTEFNAVQPKVIQRDITSYEFPMIENNLQQESIDKNIDSFLYGPKVLYSCSCANCMSHDKDIIFYEDPVSTSTSRDDIQEPFMRDLYTNMYDFYINDYSHIFDDNLMGFEETNLYCGEFGENNITKENAYTGTKSTTELIESSANMSSVDQNKLQNLQPCHIDRIQDCVGSCPTELVTYPNGIIRMDNVKTVLDDMDTSNLNSENFSMNESEIISQDEVLIPPESKKDLCIYRCSQCGKLFNKKHQLWKHFTRCDFYKENFKCHICSKTYRHKSSLAQHLRITHNVLYGLHDKFYTCNKCSKSYVRFRAFQRHVLLHDD